MVRQPVALGEAATVPGTINQQAFLPRVDVQLYGLYSHSRLPIMSMTEGEQPCQGAVTTEWKRPVRTCPHLITQTRPDDTPEDKAFTVGQPFPQTEVKIADPTTGEPVPVGQVGEVCTRGYLVMKEYFDKPEATAAAIDAAGWLHTGDLGTMDERGYCRITGRLKDMVIRGGENMFPAEIEAVLIEHPAVLEAAVVGVPDRRMGEELAAFLRVAGESPDVEQLRAHVRSRLAAPKAPRYWVFLAEFPLTGSGKIQKFRLRERWSSGELAEL